MAERIPITIEIEEEESPKTHKFDPLKYFPVEVWEQLEDDVKHDLSLAGFKEALSKLERISCSAKKSESEGSESDTLLAPSPKPKRKTDTLQVLNSSTERLSPSYQNESGKCKMDFLKVPGCSSKLQPDEVEIDPETPQPMWMHIIKLSSLLVVWFIFTYILMTKSEHSNPMHQLSVPRDRIRSFWILETPKMKRINIELGGSLLPPYYGNLSKHWASVWIELVQSNGSGIHITSEKYVTHSQPVTEVWKVPIVSESLIDFVPEVKRSNIFEIATFEKALIDESVMRVQLRTNLNKTFPVALSYDLSPIDPNDGILYAAGVLLGLYVLIIFEIVHRTLAAVLAATMSVAILAAFDERPTKAELITWIDVETLLLLFSMMVLVAILSETGIFDYLAVFAYKITNGRVWPLINTLCLFTTVVSSVLDNVTTALLMTPVTIRLCEVMELNPVPVLMAMIIYSNIGGALTPVGDPPNVIIATNRDIIDAGVSFGHFVLHMFIGLIFVMIVVHFQLRFMYRNMKDLRFKEPQDVQELRHEIAIWQRAAASLSSYSKDEDMVKETLLKKVRRLLGDLKKKLTTGSVCMDKYASNLEELQEKYPIRNVPLLVKSSITLTFVVMLFFLHSVPQLNLSLGWAALLGVLLLLLLADRDDIESVLARVEWSTLIFFTALFILMEALSRLGLINWIGQQTELIILSVEESSRLTVAILLILWVSAIASSFVDNIPLSTMMVRIVTSLSQKQELGLPLQPLVWSLALGACLGGNGTLIGASANVVCAGVAEQHGYRFSFMQFLKIGFPVMISSVIVSSFYLIIAHVVIEWNS